MIRKNISDPWREVEWDEAFAYTASELSRISAKYGKHALGGITSSRCTNEETFLVQKLVRAGFGNNNVDTCARVCHSPTGYGLKTTFGTSAGTQDFDSVEESDVILVIGANPTDAHPVFASRMKKRLRAGAKLIVVDPRRTDIVESPHVKAQHHLALQPGTTRHTGYTAAGVPALALACSERTVTYHLTNAMRKLKVDNKLAAIQRASWFGVI